MNDAGCPNDGDLKGQSRRHFFRDCGVGLGRMALASLLTAGSTRRAWAQGAGAGLPVAPHFPGRRFYHALPEQRN